MFGGASPPTVASVEELTVDAAVGAWATSANINTARYSGGNAGSTSSSLIYGGLDPSPAYRSITESWDGSSWTEVADLNTARDGIYSAGASNTTALATCGRTSNPTVTNICESWNGSSWTEVNDANQAKALGGSTAGAPYTAALLFAGAGIPLPNATTVNTESWNGTSWTEVNNLNASRYYVGGVGNQTSALCYGGYSAPLGYVSSNELWNGTSWTEVNNFTAPATGSFGNAGANNTAALKFGGSPGPGYISVVEDWNGASWQETTDLPNGFVNGMSVGVSTNALGISGLRAPSSSYPNPAETLEFTSPSNTIKVLTD